MHVSQESGAYSTGQLAARGLSSLVARCEYPMAAKLLLLCLGSHWAAWYVARLLGQITLKVVVFSVLFLCLRYHQSYCGQGLTPWQACACAHRRRASAHNCMFWEGCYIQLTRSTVSDLAPCVRCRVLRQCTPAQVSTACLDRGRAATCHTGHTWGVSYVASFPPSSSSPTSRTKGAPTEHPCCATCQSEIQGVSSCA